MGALAWLDLALVRVNAALPLEGRVMRFPQLFTIFGFLLDSRDGASPPTICSVVYVYIVSIHC